MTSDKTAEAASVSTARQRAPTSLDFRKIEFGYASAEREGATAPGLLLDGYLDRIGMIDEALNGSRFLFLGYKGSGKTAIAERSRLLAESDPSLFVNIAFLAEFPYTDFAKITPGERESASRYPPAWSWLLLLAIIDSLASDNGAYGPGAQQLEVLVRTLRELELLPVPEIKTLTLVSSKKSFRAKLPKLLEYEYERLLEGQDVQFAAVVDLLKRTVCEFRSDSRHILIVDGLDEILTKREVQYESLAGLVTEVSRLNHAFLRAGTKTKIVLLCRTDLFEKLPGANKNKIRQDSAKTLDWYHDPREPRGSGLIELVNLRAHISAGRQYDVIETHFASKIDGRESRRALLEMTRQTPRDFIRLFCSLQKFHNGVDPMKNGHVLSALRDYSLNYFLPELKDELVGYVPADDIDDFFGVLASMRSREFTRRQLSSHAKKLAPRLDTEAALAALFECSGIGTVHNSKDGRDINRITFKYRNRNSTLGLDNHLMLHRGVWKALNLA